MGALGSRSGAMQLAILSDRTSILPAEWTKETVVAILSDLRLDASAGTRDGASLTSVAILGDVRVRVPPGSRVREGGLALLGDRRVEVTPGTGSEIRINAYSIFGDVLVTDSPA
jgi:hypothetical protein